MPDIRVGDVIHGFASGMFGRESYQCRRVEAIGTDWIVARSLDWPGAAEAATEIDDHEWRYLTNAKSMECDLHA